MNGMSPIPAQYSVSGTWVSASLVVRPLAAQLLRAVKFMHECGIVQRNHRDVRKKHTTAARTQGGELDRAHSGASASFGVCTQVSNSESVITLLSSAPISPR